jgi:hypothetical protein
MADSGVQKMVQLVTQFVQKVWKRTIMLKPHYLVNIKEYITNQWE